MAIMPTDSVTMNTVCGIMQGSPVCKEASKNVGEQVKRVTQIMSSAQQNGFRSLESARQTREANHRRFINAKCAALQDESDRAQKE